MMSKIQPVVTTYDVLSIDKDNAEEMVQKNTRKKRHLKKKKTKHVRLSGRPHIEGRLNKGPRLQRKHKDGNEAKRNIRNTRERRHDVMTSANQTPRGHKFASLVASQQGRANQHEPACFGLSSPWPFPSRSGISLLHAVVQSSLGFFSSDPFCHEMFRPLFCDSAPFPLVLGCSLYEYDGAIEPYNNNRGLLYYSIIGHTERNNIITDEEWYVFVLQQIPRDFLPCHQSVRVCTLHLL